MQMEEVKEGTEVESKLWDELIGIESFRWMKKVEQMGETVRCVLQEPEEWRRKGELGIPVELIDSMFQTSIFLEKRDGFMAPFGMKEIVVEGRYKGGACAIETKLKQKTENKTKVGLNATGGGLKVLMTDFVLVDAKEDAFIKKDRNTYEIVWDKTRMKESGFALSVVGMFGENESVDEASERLERTGMIVSRNVFCETSLSLYGLNASWRSLLKLLALLQSEQRKSVCKRLYLVCDNANRILSKDNVNPWSTAMWSMGRTASKELGVAAAVVQIDMAGAWDQLGTEISTKDRTNGEEIGLRSGERYVARLSK